MSDVQSESGSSRKRVSKRDFIDENGAVVDKMEEATGARYTLVGTTGGEFDLQVGNLSFPERAFAIFGFHTKIGNVANTVLNDKDDPGEPSDAAEAIKDFLGLVDSGMWTEPAKGGVAGARVDRDALAMAIVEVFTPINAARGKPAPDLVAVREKLEDSKEFFLAMNKLRREDDKMRAAYVAAGGKEPVKAKPVTLDSAADML